MTTLARVQLCIMAKQPLPGQVKTRLARHIGDDAAGQLARAFLSDTLGLARRVAGVELALSYAGDMHNLPVDATGVEVVPQAEGDLGARMEHALRYGLARAEGAIVIGTDTPGLPEMRIERAMALLETYDAVIGPAEDGGFYLLGLRRCPEQLLAGLRWSAANTLQATLARLSERRFNVTLLPTFFDVDELSDLRRLHTALCAGELCAPATAAVLASLTAALPDGGKMLSRSSERIACAERNAQVLSSDVRERAASPLRLRPSARRRNR